MCHLYVEKLLVAYIFVGVIIKARKVLQKGSLISLYYSFIYPYLIYCNQIWGSAC